MKLFIVSMLMSILFMAQEASAIESLDLRRFSSELREHWLTRNWYYNQSMLGGRHIWTGFTNGKLEQDKGDIYRHRRFIAGYDYNQRNWSLGAAVHMHWGELSVIEHSRPKGEGFAIYGSYTSETWYLAASLHTDFSDGYKAVAADANAAGGQLELGYAFSLLGRQFAGIDKLKLVPYLSLSASRLENEVNRDLLETSIGLRTYAAASASWGTLMGRIDASWRHNMGDALPDTDRDSFQLRLGADIIEFYATLKLSLDYIMEKSSQHKEDAFALSLGLRF